MISPVTIKRMCSDDISKIENYKEALEDTTQIWCCHHRLECIETGGVCNVTAQDLKDWGIYYNRPADELIFLKRKDHQALHNRNRAEEIRLKISKANKGRKMSLESSIKKSKSTKGRKLSDEWRKHLSDSHKGNPGTLKGKHPFTNGIKNVFTLECPEGFWPGLTRRNK